MKKKLSIILMFVASIILTGCSPISNPSESEDNPSISETESTVESESSEVESESETTPPSESEEESESTPPSESEEENITYYNSKNQNAVETTISNVLANGQIGSSYGEYIKSDTLYRITGTVQFPFNTRYGNFDLVDETGYILIWGLSKNSSSMTKSGSNYSFSNDQTFSNINLKAGDKITMEGLYVSYNYSSSYHKPEFIGYIISKTDGNVPSIQGKDYTASETYSGDYYDSVDDLTGSNLLKGLHNLMMETHTNYVSYNSLKTTLKYSDQYENTSYAKCFYTGKSTSSFTREHVWAQSLTGTSSSSSTNLYGESYGGSDIHHIRPVSGNYNSWRSNAAFGPIYGPKEELSKIPYADGTYSYISGSVMEPAPAIRGDIARIIMYMYTHYSSSIANDSDTYPNIVGTMNIYFIMGPNASNSWKLLRQWNAEDPVSQDEIKRNEYAFQKQGNRNPFIDHPSYADEIWG